MEEPIQINETEPNATDPQDDQMVYIIENLHTDLEETSLQPSLPSMGSQEMPQTSSESHDETFSAEDSFKTKVVNAYYRILGLFQNGDTYKKIKKEIKCQIKNRKKSVPSSIVSKYENLLAELQQKLLMCRSQIREQIRQYEAQYYEQHHKLELKNFGMNSYRALPE